MKPLALVLLMFGHGLTQFGLSLADETWPSWMRISLFTARLLIDLAICVWTIGPERIARALRKFEGPGKRPISGTSPRPFIS